MKPKDVTSNMKMAFPLTILFINANVTYSTAVDWTVASPKALMRGMIGTHLHSIRGSIHRQLPQSTRSLGTKYIQYYARYFYCISVENFFALP
uniref:Secreted protein n=1 Tax=Parascaris univalens TaxID=6257 RepID=A0A915CD73_PARUN